MSKKRFILILAVIFTLGMAATAMAAPGDYNDAADYVDGLTPSEALAQAMAEGPFFGADREGSGLDNANMTGIVQPGDNLPTIRKAETAQWVHGDFKKNTNACASCHQTHTAAGQNLLFRNGTYSTCVGCHDGTLGRLNVFDVPTGGGLDDEVGGGSFEFGDGTGNPSMHLPNGLLQIAAAPGGNRTADLAKDGRKIPYETAKSYWGADFDCASCHAPHGSYSDRLLHYNPAGRQIERAKVYTLQIDPGNPNRLQVMDGTTVVTGPWLFYSRHGFGRVYSHLYSTASATETAQRNDAFHGRFNYNWSKGIIELKSGQTMPTDIAALRFHGVPALVVYANRAELAGNVTVGGTTAADMGRRLVDIRGVDASIDRWSGRNVSAGNNGRGGITSFCAACHTDYYVDGDAGTTTELGVVTTGTGHQGGRYDQTAYRHKIHKGLSNIPQGVGDNITGTTYNLTCLSCHFAHGTTQTIMLEADDTIARFADVNPSSALKRYTNMAVCIKCHVSSHSGALTNTDTFWNNPDIDAIYKAQTVTGSPTTIIPQ
ncbi:MAG: cytochrome c3 family protein [Clostridia bacterium]|jgi:predicted CXXCH cytochrome family protein|nr:cytochrome c3 family protein [Clostridia bacterium]